MRGMNLRTISGIVQINYFQVRKNNHPSMETGFFAFFSVNPVLFQYALPLKLGKFGDNQPNDVRNYAK